MAQQGIRLTGFPVLDKNFKEKHPFFKGSFIKVLKTSREIQLPLKLIFLKLFRLMSHGQGNYCDSMDKNSEDYTTSPDWFGYG